MNQVKCNFKWTICGGFKHISVKNPCDQGADSDSIGNRKSIQVSWSEQLGSSSARL